MTKLGVNVDHIATIRQARGETEPDPVTAAAMAELAGADGITVHLREDRRHIQDRDVMLLRRTVQTHLNLEMAATDEMVAIAMKVVPDYVTLVPEKRQELTTEGGLDVVKHKQKLTKQIDHYERSVLPLAISRGNQKWERATKDQIERLWHRRANLCPAYGAERTFILRARDQIRKFNKMVDLATRPTVAFFTGGLTGGVGP